MMYDWQVQIQQPGYTQEVQIYVYRMVGPGIQEFLIKGGYENRTVKTGERNAQIDDLYFARLPDQDVASMLLAALEKKGFPSPNNNFVAGELAGTKLHLEDMRKLVFEKPVTTHSVTSNGIYNEKV